MRVTILGGGAAGPNPGAGCSGLLVAEGDARIVFDLGPGTLAELFKHARPNEISGIVLSHMHQDHWLDLIPLRYRLKYAPGSGGVKIPLYVPPGAATILDSVARVFAEEDDYATFFGDAFEIREYHPDEILTIAGVPIAFARSVHPLPCWMMRVRCAAGDLGYTADTGVNPDAAAFLTDVRCLIVEATWLSPGAPGSHLTATEAGQLASDCGAAETVLCHLWAENDQRELLADAANNYGGRLHLAEPGLSIEWW